MYDIHTSLINKLPHDFQMEMKKYCVHILTVHIPKSV